MRLQHPGAPARLGSRSGALASASLLALMLASAGAARAQDAAPAGAPAAGNAVQEVVVTGSRIARRDYVSNSPIVTVNSQAFENTANIAIEATLNKLPQFVPDQNMTGAANSGDVQPTATHTVGISTASLRGLGPNRNLVLVDGQRMQPVNGEMVVDLNTIPSAAIDHVEVITGGASAVYGADAVGGVVNFILKKNFQGLDLDAQYGVTQHGDGDEFKVSALFGSNFADDRGNAMFGLEHYTRAPSYQRNRDFYTKGFSDPTVPNNEFFFTGAAFNPSFFNAPDPAVVSGLFAGRPAGTTVPNVGVPFYFNGDGSVFTGASGIFGGGGAAGSYRYNGPVDGTNVAHVNVIDTYSGGTVGQALKTNQTNYFVTAPLNRWSMYGSAHYDLNDWLTAYIKGGFTSSHTKTDLFPSPFITGWGVTIPRDGAHPVSADLAALLDSRPNPGATWELYLIPTNWFPDRSTVDDNNVWQVTAGFNGKVPGTDFTWDLYGSHGQASDYTQGNGYASLTRYQELLRSPNYGAGQTITGNQGEPNFGFGAATVHCTSGFYDAIFAGGTPSKDCVDAITATLQSRTLMEQNIAELDIQGGLFDLPAGQVRASLGADFREDDLQYTPDVLQSASSFADQVVGVYPTAYMNASTQAREVYGELLVPVIKDVPGIHAFNLELGARYSNYRATDKLSDLHISPQGGWTYKILGDWQITDFARLRGGYNLAVRSPNVGELFLGKQEVYAAGAATAYGDPCSLNATAPFGANPATNSGGAAGAANALAICQALMTPTGAAAYYGGVQAPGAPSPFGFVFQEGNPALNPEKAHTWTAGVVLSSPWQNPWLQRLRASVDWYDIKINGAIEFTSVDNVKAACLTLPAATAIGSPECSLLSRNPGTGAEAPTTIQYENLATIWTSGLDFQLDWGADLQDVGLGAPGAVQLNVLVNYLNKFDSQSAPGQPIQHWAGTLGPTLTGTNAGAFKFKTNTTLTYLVGPATIGLTWRYLPHVHPATWGQPGNTYLDTPAHHEFDLATTWMVSKTYMIRAGVDNLFNADPEITGAQNGIPGFTLATTGQGTTNEGLYDALGRRFYVGVKAKF